LQLEYYSENMEELYKKRVRACVFARDNLVGVIFVPEILRAYQSR
jgi:hypothetical protein